MSAGEEANAKPKKINEKKRGIRDLTTEEKWGVYMSYESIQSYRGVGRIYNMDHSTVKLLIHRINNERPGEVMTKDIFLTTPLAQPTPEHPIIKKLKKDKNEDSVSKKNKKNKKNLFQDNQGILKFLFKYSNRFFILIKNQEMNKMITSYKKAKEMEEIRIII